MAHTITRVELQGYKSLEKVDLPLGQLNVLIGANGAGKSNFLSVFRLLNALTEGQLQSHVQQAGGGSALLFYGPKRTPRLSLTLEFRAPGATNRYIAALTHVAPDRLIFAEEAVQFLPDSPITKGAGRPFQLAGGHTESVLKEAIAKKDLASKTAQFVRFQLEHWRSYHFHDTSGTAPVKQYGDVQENRLLRGDAGNLAAYLHMLKGAHPGHYEQIRETVRQAFPLFDDFVVEPSRANDSRILLTWRERGSSHEFGPHQLSDGTLRFICLTTLLLQPLDDKHAPSTITIDEPELGLHPSAVVLLASMLRAASSKAQLIVSTQSAALLGAIDEPSSVVVVERKGQASVLRRLTDEEVKPWIEEYTLGDVWEKGVFGGKP